MRRAREFEQSPSPEFGKRTRCSPAGIRTRGSSPRAWARRWIRRPSPKSSARSFARPSSRASGSTIYGTRSRPICWPRGAPITYVAAQLGHAKPTTTLAYYAHWIPSGDKRFIDRLEAIRSAAQVVDGSKVVAASEEGESEVRDSEWSRRRDLNPRPADYETRAGEEPALPSFCVLTCKRSIDLRIRRPIARDTKVFSRQTRTREHTATRGV